MKSVSLMPVSTRNLPPALMTVTHPAGGLGWCFRHALVSGQAVFVGGWYGSDEKVSSALPAGASARAAWAGSAVAPGPTTAPLGLRPSFIHDQIAVAEEASVQHLDGLRGFFPRGHLHESEPTRSPSELIGDDANRPHGPGMLEELPHVFCRSLEREIPDEEPREHHAPRTARRTERPSSQLAYGVGGGHCAPDDQHARTGSRTESAELGLTVPSAKSTVKEPGLTLCVPPRRSRCNRGPPRCTPSEGSRPKRRLQALSGT